MSEAAKKKDSRMKTWWTGLKAEFSKIIWPTKASVIRQTVIVVIITIILGLIISLLDNIIQFGLDKLIG